MELPLNRERSITAPVKMTIIAPAAIKQSNNNNDNNNNYSSSMISGGRARRGATFLKTTKNGSIAVVTEKSNNNNNDDDDDYDGASVMKESLTASSRSDSASATMILSQFTETQKAARDLESGKEDLDPVCNNVVF